LTTRRRRRKLASQTLAFHIVENIKKGEWAVREGSEVCEEGSREGGKTGGA